MKATDLMIGDWICYDGDIMHECPVQIDSISKEEADVEGDWYDEWEPIPLTTEILEKNGFEKNEKGLYKISGNIVFNIHSYRLDMYNYDSEYLPYIKICDCKYVHELQHALKLCGIEKSIKL